MTKDLSKRKEKKSEI